MTAWNLTLSGDAEHQVFPVHLPIYALSQMIPSKSDASPRIPKWFFFFCTGMSHQFTQWPLQRQVGALGEMIFHLEGMIVFAFKAVAVIYHEYFSQSTGKE